MHLERYIAKELPGNRYRWKWGILDRELDQFVPDPDPGSQGETLELAFKHQEAASYVAALRNATMTMREV